MISSDKYTDPAEALADIRQLMARSGRFLSLSGLSGLWAGVCALVAVFLAYRKASLIPFSGVDYTSKLLGEGFTGVEIASYLFSSGVLTMVIALSGAIFFTVRRSRLTGQVLWNASSRSMLFHMAIPLVVGGLLVLAHWRHGVYGFSGAITLIFYGISLLIGGRYTHDEIRYLGYLELGLGLLVAFFPSYSIDAWAIGFGVLHIIYGALMWWRNERNPSP